MPTVSEGALWSAQAHMPSVSQHPLEIVRGEGSYVHLRNGQRLLDSTAGLWHTSVGHGRVELAQAAFEQMQTLETYHLFGRFVNDQAIALAERVAKMSPIPDCKIFWTSGGSDAVETACKLSLRHWQIHGRPNKTMILSRDKAYHGLHGFGTSIAGLAPNREGYGVASLVPSTARIPTNDLSGVERRVAEIGAENIAAIVAEPVIGTGGVIPPAPGYLEGLQRLARDNDILFIVDEVITGFGRLGAMFACERFGLEPDMVLIAKGITSGYMPLGGVLVAKPVWSPYFGDGREIFRHGLTYSGHATACAVAARNLQILEDEALVGRVARLEATLQSALSQLTPLEGVRDVRVCGLLGGVQLDPAIDGDKVSRRCLDAGVVMRVINDNTLHISPPFIITEAELAQIADAIRAAIMAELRRAA